MLLLHIATLGTFALDDKRNGVGKVSLGKVEAWNVDVFQAERTFASFAVKVDVTIVMVANAIFLAQLIVEYATSILEGMHHLVL